MAQAIVKHVHKKDTSINFVTYTPSFTRAKELADVVKGKAVKDLNELQDITFFLIACKPQQFKELAIKLQPLLNNDSHVVSIMAAVGIDSISRLLGTKNVTRVMPNTPTAVGEGVSLIYHAQAVPLAKANNVISFFELCSEVIPVVDDMEMDLATVVAGSGPAYLYEFARGMADYLEVKGIDKDRSKAIVDQLFLGSSALMKQSTQTYQQLIDAVTSKGGVTIEAVETYRKMKLSGITENALDAALERSEEITRAINS
jgi:pyrroline-5-carboxylate reductase